MTHSDSRGAVRTRRRLLKPLAFSVHSLALLSILTVASVLFARDSDFRDLGRKRGTLGFA
ncbi:uncharacterized protein G2W53_011090 [Senna tora]|uniref:Uncharacterized protein n=1 Tax=Senna tora TaxID=362788 RepID=A0A835CA86_9FABA|nr:uncharacterized protein G2W53_011090 [Senna tora]